MIYFIRCGEFVKIGRAGDPMERVKQLQIGNPYDVELMGTIEGNDAEEMRLHPHSLRFTTGRSGFS